MVAMDCKPTSCLDDHTSIRKALVSGLFLNAAVRQEDNTYKVVSSGQIASLHPSSTMMGKRPECIIFNELILTGKAYAQCVTSVETAWLSELVPRFFMSSPAL